ncbi:peptidoglycan editing factor PgeF [Stenotrophomonas sp.]|uniref:peptidoglycan editing factor PgeF n=1 Tax=Stenotrophomonas sp. TaxID=69392 RepID=UPI0028A29E9D|nr:peptidoglycan editing factor PgeF [Stenotrophomonas sp.]
MAAALPLLQADWPAPPGVRSLTTRRHGAGISPAPFDQFNLGNRHAADGDTPANVEHNRHLLQQGLGLPSAPHWLRQVHSSTVLRFKAPPQPGASEPVADAAVTSERGVVLAILTADCLPVVFAAADGSEVGAAHAGWRGLANGMLEHTVTAMTTAPAQLRAWLGPAAGPQDYEIGEEVYHAFVGHDPAAAAAFVATREGHWKVDLFALARQRLQGAGLDLANIHGGSLSTMADPDLYSHRRDRRTGRMATLVWME